MALKTPRVSKRRIGTSLSEINVTPFVDVMLVLLIIFMVTAPMIQSGIGVNLPQAETDAVPAEEGLTLSITKDLLINESMPVKFSKKRNAKYTTFESESWYALIPPISPETEYVKIGVAGLMGVIWLGEAFDMGNVSP